ncbi:glycogen operon protein GlgX [Amycolatopsis australiensis]|uniref:Glycogen operon protein GlgX n=1 Tax=Amycolatopsis australiensis TaxID=546364 RepID=A0A1K1SNC9_9PSEU|nr:glycogen operon protein GlgX [Amycolatopsis australiensis]SFW85397.1 hypothetical protein SAMN04489730_6126 [Amycolatopsis australiensis]
MSLDQQVQPAPSGDPVDTYYGRLFGWPVRWRGGQPFLALEHGMCAVTLPKLSAAPVLTRLAATGCQGPSMVLPTQHGARVALLAETDGLIPPRDALPRDVDVLAWGTLLPLPVGTRRREVATEWLTAPDPHRRWLPSLGAILAAIPARL